MLYILKKRVSSSFTPPSESPAFDLNLVCRFKGFGFSIQRLVLKHSCLIFHPSSGFEQDQRRSSILMLLLYYVKNGHLLDNVSMLWLIFTFWTLHCKLCRRQTHLKLNLVSCNIAVDCITAVLIYEYIPSSSQTK